MVRITFTDGRPGVQTETLAEARAFMLRNWPEAVYLGAGEGRILVWQHYDGCEADATIETE